jgi:hypothetical protein
MKLYRIKKGQSVLVYDERSMDMVDHTMKNERIFDYPAGDPVTQRNGSTYHSPKTIGGHLIRTGYALFDTSEGDTRARYPFIALPYSDVDVMC